MWCSSSAAQVPCKLFGLLKATLIKTITLTPYWTAPSSETQQILLPFVPTGVVIIHANVWKWIRWYFCGQWSVNVCMGWCVCVNIGGDNPKWITFTVLDLNESVNDDDDGDIWLPSYAKWNVMYIYIRGASGLWMIAPSKTSLLLLLYRKAYLHKITVHCPQGHENEYECVSSIKKDNQYVNKLMYVFKCIA